MINAIRPLPIRTLVFRVVAVFFPVDALLLFERLLRLRAMVTILQLPFVRVPYQLNPRVAQFVSMRSFNNLTCQTSANANLIQIERVSFLTSETRETNRQSNRNATGQSLFGASTSAECRCQRFRNAINKADGPQILMWNSKSRM